MEIKNKLEFILLIGAITLTLIMGLIYVFQITSQSWFSSIPEGSDMLTYHNWAKDVVEGRGLPKGVFGYSPLYPSVFLPVIYFLFGIRPLPVYIIQVFLGALCTFLVYLIGKRAFNNWVGIGAAFFHALYRLFIIYYGAILSEVLVNFLFLAAIFAFLKVLDKPSLRNKIICGTLFGLASLAKPTMHSFFPFLIIPMFVSYKEKKKAFSDFIVILSVSFLTIFPVTIRNYKYSGNIVLVSVAGGHNFLLGNNPGASGDDFRSDYYQQVSKEAENLSPVEKENFYFQKGFEFIKSNPKEFLRQLARKFSFFWGSFHVPNNLNFYFLRRKVGILKFPLLVPIQILVSLGIAGMFLSLKKWRNLLTLYLFIIIYSSVIILFFVLGRYTLPVFPFLCIFSAFAIYIITKKFLTRKYFTAIGAIFLIFILLWIEYGYARPFFFRSGVYLDLNGSLFIRDEDNRVVGATLLKENGTRIKKDLILDRDPFEYRQAFLILKFAFVNEKGFLFVSLNKRLSFKLISQGSSHQPQIILNLPVSPSVLVRGYNQIIIQPLEGAEALFFYDTTWKYGRSFFAAPGRDFIRGVNEKGSPGEFIVRLQLNR